MPKERTTDVAEPESRQSAPRVVEADAFRELASLRPAVLAVARHVLGFSAGAAQVDDCAAEVFRRALEGRRTQGAIPLRPWLLGMARHVALDARRAERRARARGDGAGDALLAAVPDEAPGALHVLELAERARRLQTALDALPAEQRRALLMHAEGHGYREIGERLSVPLGTVCTWLARARRDLTQALAEAEREERT